MLTATCKLEFQDTKVQDRGTWLQIDTEGDIYEINILQRHNSFGGNVYILFTPTI